MFFWKKIQEFLIPINFEHFHFLIKIIVHAHIFLFQEQTNERFWKSFFLWFWFDLFKFFFSFSNYEDDDDDDKKMRKFLHFFSFYRIIKKSSFSLLYFKNRIVHQNERIDFFRKKRELFEWNFFLIIIVLIRRKNNGRITRIL